MPSVSAYVSVSILVAIPVSCICLYPCFCPCLLSICLCPCLCLCLCLCVYPCLSAPVSVSLSLPLFLTLSVFLPENEREIALHYVTVQYHCIIIITDTPSRCLIISPSESCVSHDFVKDSLDGRHTSNLTQISCRIMVLYYTYVNDIHKIKTPNKNN